MKPCVHGDVTDTERREVTRRLRGLARDVDDVSDFDLARALGLEATSRYGYDSGDVLRLADLIEPQEITGDTSDGYHTFDELYDHRAKLFSVIVRCFKDRAWKSRFHHDGTMYEGMFIVGVETPQGQATYHYDIDMHWDIFDCKELARAPEWDGHTPEQAISRIASLRPSCDRDALLALADELEKDACWEVQTPGNTSVAQRLKDTCDLIREALGVEDYADHDDEPAQRQAMEAKAVQQRPMPRHREVPVGKG